ncbi:MAG: L,D-transpeptidase family protein [Betaproteobacteria bacterium]
MLPPTLSHPAPSCPYAPLRQLALCSCLALAATASRAGELLWFADGQPRAASYQAVSILAAAAAEGLDPSDYDADRLRGALGKPGSLPAGAPDDLDRALTTAMERFLLDVRRGRIDPAQIGEEFSPNATAALDPNTLLRQAISDDRLADAVAAARPHLAQYDELRAVLARYRPLKNHPAWRTPLPPLPGRKLEPGGAWPGLGRLMQRLEVLGDLPGGSSVPPRYSEAAVAGVRAFQQRHGLTPDGVIGKGTIDAIEVPPGTRIRQIELALERLRWTPQPERMVVVNVPEFVLRGIDARDGRSEERVAMNVIVGNAAKTQTPIFSAEMRYIEFSPYWNVPPSIARGETIPKLRRDPGYFHKQGFEFVGSDGRVTGELSEANLAAAQSGRMRIRQRPGASNALGDIKFVFPNVDNIYLHHTPTPQLFKRDRRDFSHGCIRVEKPVELAKFVLAGQPEWDEERIVAAMTRGRSATLRLEEPLPVIIAYRTAAVIGGQVRFFPDLYGRDARLRDALEGRRQSRVPSG